MESFDISSFTKYERTRIIGSRALQIAMGAPILITRKQSEIDPIQLAKREVEKGVVPLTIKRILPRNATENQET